MMKRCWTSAMLCLCIAAAVAGCAQPKITVEMLRQMKPPERPKELAMLEPMVGSWTMSGDMKMAGLDQTLACSGTYTTGWECDGRVLVERAQFEVPDLGDAGKMSSFSMTMYDPREKEFHTVWTMSNGEVNHGEMEFDEATKTWRMEGKGWDPMTKSMKKTRGTMKMPDSSTAEWTHEEYDALGLTKMMEIKGASKRK